VRGVCAVDISTLYYTVRGVCKLYTVRGLCLPECCHDAMVHLCVDCWEQEQLISPVPPLLFYCAWSVYGCYCEVSSSLLCVECAFVLLVHTCPS
jgi:hypothetical protein